MGTRQSTQHGFSAVELVLILAICSVVGLIGWYIFTSSDKASDPVKVKVSARSRN